MPIIKKNDVTPERPVIIVLYGTPGTGKAQPLSCKVLTPKGYVRLSELNVGDEVINPKNGLPQVVEGIFPQGIRPVYRVTMNDGAQTFCDEEHLWNVRHRGGNSQHAGFRNFTLKHLIEKGIYLSYSQAREDSGRKTFYRWEIPVTSPIDYPEKEYVIHPYLLGVLIGDGCLTGDTMGFSNPDSDIEIAEFVSSLISEEYHLSKNIAPACPFYNISKNDRYKKDGNIYTSSIKELGLNVISGKKFIPESYKYGSKEQRVELLRGLMDTDGSSRGSRITYSTTSERLAFDIQELVRSLGGIAKISAFDRTTQGKCVEYCITIKIGIQPFRLKRKAELWHERKASRYISEVIRVDDCECACIKVSGEDELYVTDDYIVTHNTSLATTASNPLLIDTDRGYDRAVQRCDTLTASKWEDITAEYDTMKGYKTIIVDTAKAALDDFLATFAIQKNYKLATNALKRFGQMGDDFKLFVNKLRENGSDIIFICHDKEIQEGDIIKHSPDCTGQSKDLLLRIADQVGYVSKVNGQRTVTFEPTDTFIGKNVAQIPLTVIPDASNPDFSTYMDSIITRVKTSIQNKSEAQRKANEQLSELREQLEAAMTEEDIDALIIGLKSLPSPLQLPFHNEMKSKLQEKGWKYENKKYVKDEQAA